MKPTIDEIRSEIFIPSLNMDWNEGEICREGAERYLNRCIDDMEKQMDTLYPDVQYKATMVEYSATSMFMVILMVVLNEGIRYLMQPFSWIKNQDPGRLRLVKVR